MNTLSSIHKCTCTDLPNIKIHTSPYEIYDDPVCPLSRYITGSGWKEYTKKGTVCGIPLPEGLKECAKLETPLFTPSTKAEIGGHDENIPPSRAAEIVGDKTCAEVRCSFWGEGLLPLLTTMRTMQKYNG